MLLPFVVVVGTITAMTYKEKQASIKYQGQCYENSAEVAGAVPKQNQRSAQECQDPKDYMPWWYILITWPEGITTWAIIATGAVIAWQSWETRRSVLVNLRPKLVIRGIEIPPSNSETERGDGDIFAPRHIRIAIANAGGSEAQVTDSNVTFVKETKFSEGLHIVLPAFPPYNPNGMTLGPFKLQAGEHVPRTLQLGESMAFTFMLRDGGGSGAIRGAWFCYGYLAYSDKMGINRRMGFGFRYDISENQFTRMKESEYNYSD
jgi:hypothetical protein